MASVVMTGRQRSYSDCLSDRFCSDDSIQCGVSCNVDGLKVVLRNTFLELQSEATSAATDTSDVASCCCSDHASDTTAMGSWCSMTDDEIDATQSQEVMPPGNFWMLPQGAQPMVLLMPGSLQAVKLKSAGSVWGSKRKQTKKETSWTTLVIKNLPENCTNSSILELLNAHGFATMYDFVYVPTDFRNYAPFGYAFVNLISHEAAESLIERLHGSTFWDQDMPLVVDWSMPHQGHAVHVRRFQNSPVMHPRVPDEYKPMIFRHGVRQQFPAPTKKIKEPRLRRGQVTGSFTLDRHDA